MCQVPKHASGLQGFNFKAKARIWPCLSFVNLVAFWGSSHSHSLSENMCQVPKHASGLLCQAPPYSGLYRGG